ncbi:MAG: hypothetical protein MJY71_07540 [Bacteroidaceae bacterium]|nr:hypothetical protein [Bacteroidaceae bacterium]
MKKDLLKYLGAIVVILGAILLIISSFAGLNNNNGVQFTGIALMIVGVIAYIIMNKKIED